MALLGTIVAIVGLSTVLVGLPVYLLACRLSEWSRTREALMSAPDVPRPRRHRL